MEPRLEEGRRPHFFPLSTPFPFFHFLLAAGVIISPRSESISPLPSDLTLNPLYLLKSLPSKTDRQNTCCYTDFISSLI